MLDGSLLYEKPNTKWTKTLRNVQTPNTIFSLVTTTVISRHSCKTSK